MARIKIRGRKDPIQVDNQKARQIKILRFGDFHGIGKADPMEDLDLGDEWAGTIGQVDWIELDKAPQSPKFKFIYKVGSPGVAFQVPMDHQLQEGEELA